MSAKTETPLLLNLADDAELIREFILEGQDHLQNIESGVLRLEENPRDPETLNSIFRAFHTFKGGAGFLNLAPIHDLAHELESLLDLARQNKLTIHRPIANVILAGADSLKTLCEQITERLASGDTAPIVVPTSELLDTVRVVMAGAGNECEMPALPGAAAPEPEHTETKRADAAAIKVNTQKLDELIDAVGEMVIIQSLISQSAALPEIEDEKLLRYFAQMGRVTTELQRTAMALRMVPIRATFQKMQRVVRDSSAKIEKRIELVTSGEETELDRTIVEEISDPLIHMVRNSVDHGIERAEAREAAGKSAQGTISLRAFHQSGNIVIEIKDDGAGLNREAILRKAIEKGLIGADETLSDSEIFNLIFAPGFSTAARVTELSGRGVGMDVVRRNIEKLRGKIDIQSAPGQGATFCVYLPLTLAIIDGLVVGVSHHRYILPTLSVLESFRLEPGTARSVQGRGEVVEARGRLLPVARLRNVFELECDSATCANEIAVIIQSTSGERCIVVDTLVGKQEVVIKNFGDFIPKSPHIAGAAILGDGRVGLILDPHSLVNLSAGRELKEAA